VGLRKDDLAYFSLVTVVPDTCLIAAFLDDESLRVEPGSVMKGYERLLRCRGYDDNAAEIVPDSGHSREAPPKKERTISSFS
jgi:hypothetical protein